MKFTVTFPLFQPAAFAAGVFVDPVMLGIVKSTQTLAVVAALTFPATSVLVTLIVLLLSMENGGLLAGETSSGG